MMTLTTLIASSSPLAAVRRNLLEECHAHAEFRSLSVDGAYNICFTLVGQAKFKVPLRVREQKAVPGMGARLITGWWLCETSPKRFLPVRLVSSHSTTAQP